MSSQPPPPRRSTTGLFAEPIGKSLNQFQNSVFDKSMLELIRLGTQWHYITGDLVSRCSRPVKLRYSKNGGTLQISASSAIALEIQHLQPVILERMQEILGHRRITRLQLVQGG